MTAWKPCRLWGPLRSATPVWVRMIQPKLPPFAARYGNPRPDFGEGYRTIGTCTVATRSSASALAESPNTSCADRRRNSSCMQMGDYSGARQAALAGCRPRYGTNDLPGGALAVAAVSAAVRGAVQGRVSQNNSRFW